MRIITEHGELALPSDFSIAITKNSTYHSTEGEQSIPLTIANTASNRIALDIKRINTIMQTEYKIPIRLYAGAYIRDGYIIVDSYTKSEISAAITLAESDIYAIYTDMALSELFRTVVRDDFEDEDDKVTAWANYLYQVSAGEIEDDFTCFPILLDKQDNGYFITNLPDVGSSATPIMDMVYQSRVISSSDTTEQVPIGYGLSPYLYLYKFIELLFEQMGYTVKESFFNAGLFKKIVLINNCVDSICQGVINYSYLVPSCTVGEFLEFIEKRFNCFVFVSFDSKSVSIKNLDNALNSNYDIDITSMFSDDITTTISEGAELVIGSDVSLEGAEAAANTYAELVNKYPIITELSEEDFLSSNYKYSVYFRRCTGEYIVNAVNTSGSGITKQRLGTNYFTYGNSAANNIKESKAADVLPPMVIVDMENDNILLAPFAGDKIHNTTSYEDEDAQNQDQQIILALDAGIADIDDNHKLRYRLATTQKYNNIGVEWATCSITPHDMFFKCFKHTAAMYKPNNYTLTGVVNYSLIDFMRLDISSIKYYKGVLFLPNYINYSINRDIVVGESSFMLYNKNIEVATDVIPTQQLYYWEDKNELNDVIAGLETSGMIIEHWYNDSADEDFKYLPPPTELGVIGYIYYRSIHIRESLEEHGTQNEYDIPVKHWYESAAL